MSIDKTLRHTNESGSEITSLLDNKLRTPLEDYSETIFGIPKLSSSHSLKSLRIESPRFSSLEHENEALRTEVAALKRELRIQKEETRINIHGYEEEIVKLKKLIEKSYYSLKKLEEENIGIKEENKEILNANTNMEKRMEEYQISNKSLENKSIQFYQYIQEIKRNHDKEVSIIWERVSSLQKNLESIVNLIEEDRLMEKKFKFLRTPLESSPSEKKLSHY